MQNAEGRRQNGFSPSAFCILHSAFQTMFEEFFGFTIKPFGKTPDPAFLFESPQHREALARLEYAVEEKDLALLVGHIGSGKTMLSRALMDRIGETRPVVLLI